MHAEKPFVEVAVGKAEPKDLPTVIRIYSQHEGARCIGVGCENTFVARNESQGIVGAITIRENRFRLIELGSPWVELVTICVDKDLERRGIGRQMISQVIEEVKKGEIHKIEVKVRTDQPALKHIFDTMGFEVDNSAPLKSKMTTMRKYV